MKSTVQSPIFGRRKERHTVIIARGDEVRHFTIHPWLAAFVGSALAALAIGYLLATSYLVFRDDLLGAATARQARIQQAYEDRISALRAQVDRITSRQMLDQQLMETKVGELLERQAQLSQRHGRLGPILDRAATDGVSAGPVADNGPAKPDERASLIDKSGPQAEVLAQLGAPADEPFSFWSTRKALTPSQSSADKADKLFIAINQSLRSIEDEQLNRVNTLAEGAYQTADAITAALADAGLPVDLDDTKKGVGGPYIPISNPATFDTKVRELDQALDKLEKIKIEVAKLPIANPAPGRAVSSTFGIRKDPLLGTPALHSGMDFRAPLGSEARVTAAGTVIKAGWNGGYGRMIEVDHGDGLTTRYAHLSKIMVAEGQKLNAGDVVGLVGTSGRSTGPHLHYEVREEGTAVDPLRFLKAGKRVSQLL